MADTNNNGVQSLGFNWDEHPETQDFFGVEGTALKTKQQVIAEQTPTSTETKPAETTEETETSSLADVIGDGEEVEFNFDLPSEQQSEEQTTSTETQEVTEEESDKVTDDSTKKTSKQNVELSEDFYTNLALDLKDKEILSDFELEEGKQLTADEFIELQNKEIQAGIDQHFESFFSELDDEGAAFLKFKKEGGSTKDFLRTYSTFNEKPDSDTSTEESQEAWVKYYLKTVDKKDDNEVEDLIKYYKESSKLKTYADSYKSKVDTLDQQNKEKLLQQQQLNREKAEENRKKYDADIRMKISQINTIGEFNFTDKIKRSLPDYILKPVDKTPQGRVITGVQKELAEAFQIGNENKLFQLAAFLQSGYMIPGIAKKKTTEVTKETKMRITQGRNRPSSTNPSSVNRKQLADFI